MFLVVGTVLRVQREKKKKRQVLLISDISLTAPLLILNTVSFIFRKVTTILLLVSTLNGLLRTLLLAEICYGYT